ncbi:bone morphogenetic protein receptor type-1A-like isoform X2 [Panonychus citri]|nr:bone morphogenetic protein receptor type-1A-like isoform X2 [Panonychus citri]XP_053200410.1 bone morphogenetic protein receptor type-1A-like isoform X2 [Panonychus citri]
MGFGDIAEFIKKVNHTNETTDWPENVDGNIDNIDVGLDQIEEETILFTIPPTSVIAIILISIIILLFILNSTTKCHKSVYKFLKNYNKQFNQLLIFHNDKRFNRDKSLSSPIKSYEETSSSLSSSGSGHGDVLFRQRTISDQIDFIGRIEVGSFGRVWVCNYRGQAIACRVYNTIERNLWSHEADIQIHLKNPEVVGMIHKDIRDDPITCATKFLIFTDYFPNGSLHSFLKRQPVDEITMINLIYSIARGLHHLHSIILGNPDKPAVIHFNIKSRNIMVANCGSRCLISDFSSACLYNRENRISESPKLFNSSSDSLRYRAPELLNNNQVPNDLQLARACDVYSLSLVIWEIASRCLLLRIDGSTYWNNYKLPYEDELNNQPPNEQTMYQLVHLNQVRPKIDNNWFNSPILTKIIKILNESWTSSPSSRLTALRIMKDLDNLRESLLSIDDDKKNRLISIELS